MIMSAIDIGFEVEVGTGVGLGNMIRIGVGAALNIGTLIGNGRNIFSEIIVLISMQGQ